jgi:hypothetical protein
MAPSTRRPRLYHHPGRPRGQESRSATHTLPVNSCALTHRKKAGIEVERVDRVSHPRPAYNQNGRSQRLCNHPSTNDTLVKNDTQCSLDYGTLTCDVSVGDPAYGPHRWVAHPVDQHKLRGTIQTLQHAGGIHWMNPNFTFLPLLIWSTALRISASRSCDVPTLPSKNSRVNPL